VDRREIQEQKQAILEFAQREGLTVSRLIEMSTSATMPFPEKNDTLSNL
jgi:hypothetical protein